MKKSFTTKNIILIGMFTAIMAILSQFSIPLPGNTPLTLQTFGAVLLGCVLGWKHGTTAMLVYLLLGAVGVPVFSGFRGGLGVLTSYTGGFLFGFLFLTFFSGLWKKNNSPILQGVCMAVGLCICYFFGALQYSLIAGVGFWQGVMISVAPFVIKDVVSLIIAAVAGRIICKSINKMGLQVNENA